MLSESKFKKGGPHIAFIGEPGFPVGFGSIQRISMMGQGLIHHGCNVTVISYKGVHGPSANFPASGEINGIHYLYTSGTIYRHAGFFRRNLSKLKGKGMELVYLRLLKKKGDLSGCVVSTMKIHVLWIYWLWLKMIKVPLILDYVELNSAIASRTRVWQRINDYLFDRIAINLSSAVTPISEFLVERVKLQAPRKQLLKLPILCDFEKFDPTDREGDEVRITYCGSASYKGVVDFVLNMFALLDLSHLNKKIFLELILGGAKEDISAINEAVLRNANHQSIRLFVNVPHHQIPTYYARSSALLIPLRPTLQDSARFPHKLGEYLAAGRPVITNYVGEVNHYNFLDGETALIADEYDPVVFLKKIMTVIDEPERARLIGLRGRSMGVGNFNYKDWGLALKHFILSVKVLILGTLIVALS